MTNRNISHQSLSIDKLKLVNQLLEDENIETVSQKSASLEHSSRTLRFLLRKNGSGFLSNWHRTKIYTVNSAQLAWTEISIFPSWRDVCTKSFTGMKVYEQFLG